jgi:molybdate transport system substrate-binding protein
LKVRINRAAIVLTFFSIALAAFGQTKPTGTTSGKTAASTSTAGGELKIAAAADLAVPLQAIVKEFEKSQNAKVQPTYAASGMLATQIEQGAPFDVFMSADTGYAKRLIEKKLADPKTFTVYTRGRLILYVLPGIPEDVTHVGLKALTDPIIKRIAIANPEHAPYGRAAVDAMKHAGVYDQVKSKIVTAENVGQAAQFVKSGNAEAGLLALSAMFDRDMRRHGRVVEIDMNAYPALDQAAVVTKHGQNNPLARAFVEYLNTQMAQGLFARYGFMPPSTYKDTGGRGAPKKTETKPAKKPATKAPAKSTGDAATPKS